MRHEWLLLELLHKRYNGQCKSKHMSFKKWEGGGVQTSRAITLTGNYAININMADEKSPLLQSTDEDEGPRLRHHHAFPTTHRSTDLSPVTSTEADHIVCVFVVTFDTRSGKTTIRCQHK